MCSQKNQVVFGQLLPLNLSQKHACCSFKMYMARATKNYKLVCQIKLEAKQRVSKDELSIFK